jgi:hypothetical protein
LKKGDKVKLKGRPEVTGEVIDERHINVWGIPANEFKVKYDDSNLIPTEDWHSEELLEQIETELPSGTKIEYNKCECGAKYNRHFPDSHSTWCNMYKKY